MILKTEVDKGRLIKIYEQLFYDYHNGGSKGLEKLISLMEEKGIEINEDGYVKESCKEKYL